MILHWDLLTMLEQTDKVDKRLVNVDKNTLTHTERRITRLEKCY